ncbi:dihydrofolate synthase / folylpolyglutamate synthase [Mariprofundus micogutta]|uniref:Dihydrofolate synthase / folylpolyglutamate synthase n=1 Tax=Mariprofundus micogutta TaxID=1921010 RepID=A0A1L8CML6_9PROT|nr:cyanophycin synthetase [Mariprofundus micogutta]GAV20153.1 dihydrofolate synthase / folylpolyglutamate synthase [Mariprofundus micogutta]
MTEKPHSIERWLTELGNPSADRDYKPGHERVRQLLSHIHNHQPGLRIRIAGTNGKGSTSTMLAAALQSCGLKVGLYTSPHILEFNERIRINGVPAETEKLQQSMQRLMPEALAAGASYFETATALALEQFALEKVDVEILEAGVGARLDATTAIPADMALITPIGLDHQAWLGDSIVAIAEEKSFVMQGCRFSITAQQSPEVSRVLDTFKPQLVTANTMNWPYLAVAGEHQHINASLAYAAVKTLRQAGLISCDLNKAKAAIADCKVPGRLEKINIGQASVWLDAAHNRHAIEAILPSLASLADPFDAILVFTREDRSLADEIALLEPYGKQVIYKSGAAGEGQSISLLHQQLAAQPNGSFLLLGSFITVAEILLDLAQRQTR